MDRLWEEFETGEIHFRDRCQFELKSEFSPIAGLKQSEYTQEFFIFIPTALQINSQTYSKNDFFRAQTNLIRFSTPDFTFVELLDSENPHSPFVKLKELRSALRAQSGMLRMELELKLLANIYRKTIRNAVYPLIRTLEKASSNKDIEQCKMGIDHLLLEVNRLEKEFISQKEATLELPEGLVLHHIFEYIQDVMSISLNSSMTALLEAIRKKAYPLLQGCDIELSKLLLREKKYREDQLKEPNQLDKDAAQNEAILYQSGLLNKFILDALQLKTQRLAIDEKLRSIIGSFAAGMAMFLYLLLFIWQGAVFVINSLPFIFFTVIIYIVKDRIKEELKSLSYKHVFKWFPDYTTEVRLPTSKEVVGLVHESFSFIGENRVPMDISHLRNQEFHSYLEMIKRQEQVIHYKRRVVSYGNFDVKTPLKSLNIIFRYDISNFLAKASDPYEPYVTLDSNTLNLNYILLPKVYHINIILKNTYLKPDLTEAIECKKFRIVADKEGIKRIESVTAEVGKSTETETSN